MNEAIVVETPAWSADARLAMGSWYGMDSATRWLYIKRFGVEETIELDTQFFRTHQKAHFLDGSEKLGITDQPHHVWSALYHALSNQLGGLDMGYRPDTGDGKAWVFYLPPSPYAGAPLLPTPAIAGVPTPVVIATFRGWHAHNGVALGNDRLQFTLTDLMQEGGPYDAGYFSEALEPVSEEDRLVVALGSERVEYGPPPALGSAQWPQARRDIALRKYAGEYAMGGLGEIAKMHDMDLAAQMAEDSHRCVFLQWARVLVADRGIKEADQARRVAQVFRLCFESAGDEFDEEGDGADTVLIQRRTRLSVPQYSGWETPPRPIEDAFARAWTTISRSLGPEVTVTVDESRSEGAEVTSWRFS